MVEQGVYPVTIQGNLRKMPAEITFVWNDAIASCNKAYDVAHKGTCKEMGLGISP